jgi:hypothetical protein
MTGRTSRAGRLLATATLAVSPILFGATGSPAQAAPAEPVPQTAPAGDCGRPATQPGDAPVLAHFYMWFNASSWARAKVDYPSIGRYSSDQPRVMAAQVAQAQEAGIDGFIVGWRSTDVLNSRLATLRRIAAEQGFKLAITYQAQDFHRKPLPPEQVRRDLEELARQYADDPVFHLLGARPVVALSGTWHYSAEQLRSITEPVSSRLLVLATEKNTDGYERVAPAVEGNLYYWSSGDPPRTPGYQEKLLAMADALRANCGVWIAPVAPGFDARLVGGRSVVERRDGATLRSSWEAALASVPDAIGVISWNEFSENTHIEPSTDFGTRYLDEVRDLTGSPPPPAAELDSSASAGPGSADRTVLALGLIGGSFVLVTVVGARRRRQLLRR